MGNVGGWNGRDAKVSSRSQFTFSIVILLFVFLLSAASLVCLSCFVCRIVSCQCQFGQVLGEDQKESWRTKKKKKKELRLGMAKFGREKRYCVQNVVKNSKENTWTWWWRMTSEWRRGREITLRVASAAFLSPPPQKPPGHTSILINTSSGASLSASLLKLPRRIMSAKRREEINEKQRE